MQKTAIVLILLVLSPSSQAMGYQPVAMGLSGYNSPLNEILTIAEAGTEQDRRKAESEERDKKDKKCMTICKRWGEDCIINPRTGSRDCRRTCKEFGEECF